MDKEKEKWLSDIVEEHYETLCNHTYFDIFKRSDQMYGYSPKDVLNEAIINVIEAIKKSDKDFDYKGMENYFYKSVMQKLKEIKYDLWKKNSTRSKNINNIFDKYYSDKNPQEEREELEHRELINSLSSGQRLFLRLKIENKTVREIMNIMSISQSRYQKIKSNLQHKLQEVGL